MAVDFNIKDKYSFNDLIEIMQLLRSENGCPWDREQTHESIKNNFI
ncbi:MAG: nucleoside triphosphate pyrophosphohydrolase, partial [Oscillospiraceae bacterium]